MKMGAAGHVAQDELNQTGARFPSVSGGSYFL